MSFGDNMETQLHILYKVLEFMVYVFPRIVPTLVLCNIFLETGLMKRLMPLGRRFTEVAHLPAEVSLPFISSFGSSYVGGAIVVDLLERKLVFNPAEPELSLAPYQTTWFAW